MATFNEFLETTEACQEAIDWVGDSTLEDAWESCMRADWMLWLAGMTGISKKKMIFAACECLGSILQYLPKEDVDRCSECICLVKAYLDHDLHRDEILRINHKSSITYDIRQVDVKSALHQLTSAVLFESIGVSHMVYVCARLTPINSNHNALIMCNIVSKHIPVERIAKGIDDQMMIE